MAQLEDYRSLISDLVRKQMVMLGPNLVISKARQIPGLTVADDGTVSELGGDPAETLQKVVDVFMELSGKIAKMTLDTLLEKYPEVKKPSV